MKKTTSAFTLIELLVVITIIAILASIALPVFNSVTVKANQTKDLANAKQVGLALKLFAGDNNGSYPQFKDPDSGTGTITTSNDAYRELFPNYLTSETIFYLAGSAWTPKPPDNRYDLMPVGGTYTQTLLAGENNFAYVTNLTDSSNPSFPLVADGFNSIAKYSVDKTQKGGVWVGQKAIVIFVDNSGAVLKCDSTNLAPTRTTSTGSIASIFDTTDPAWLGTTNLAVDPL